MKTLTQLADELEQSLDNLELNQFAATPKVCHYCNKLQTDQPDIMNIYYEGKCLLCAHCETEAMDDLIADSNEIL
jgi:hypothetical protein